MALGARLVPEALVVNNGTEVGTGATLNAGCTATFVVAVGKVGGAPCVVLVLTVTS
jgi:hypothetical protein